MNKIALGGAVAVAAGGAIAAAVVYGGGGGGGAYGGGTNSAPAGATTINTAGTRIGTILVDGAGRSLYLFEPDPADKSVCNGQCASVWPPLTATGTVHAGSGVTASQLGVIHRKDGTPQVTYHGHALYYFAGDHERGDITGEGLDQFGGGWDVLAPSGNKIEGGE